MGMGTPDIVVLCDLAATSTAPVHKTHATELYIQGAWRYTRWYVLTSALEDVILREIRVVGRLPRGLEIEIGQGPVGAEQMGAAVRAFVEPGRVWGVHTFAIPVQLTAPISVRARGDWES